jgi:hypothetical protein
MLSVWDVIKQEELTGKNHPWCDGCLAWHFGDCSRDTRRPWWDKILLTFGPPWTENELKARK